MKRGKKQPVVVRFMFSQSIKRAYHFAEAINELGVAATVKSFNDAWGVETDSRCLKFADQLVKLLERAKEPK